jgi:hypothetical protein
VLLAVVAIEEDNALASTITDQLLQRQTPAVSVFQTLIE